MNEMLFEMNHYIELQNMTSVGFVLFNIPVLVSCIPVKGIAGIPLT